MVSSHQVGERSGHEQLFLWPHNKEIRNMDLITRTAQRKTYENWKGPLSAYLQVGDSVCEELEMHFLEVVPPACWERDLIQLGEASDHNGAGNSARFETLQKHCGEWLYTGARMHRERVPIAATPCAGSGS
jgi:hypothetical protein